MIPMVALPAISVGVIPVATPSRIRGLQPAPLGSAAWKAALHSGQTADADKRAGLGGCERRCCEHRSVLWLGVRALDESIRFRGWKVCDVWAELGSRLAGSSGLHRLSTPISAPCHFSKLKKV